MKTAVTALETRMVGPVISALELECARTAVLYLSPKRVVRATRQFKQSRRATRDNYIVTIGAPNFAERAAIKVMQRGNIKFPLKFVIVKGWPVPKPKKAKRK